MIGSTLHQPPPAPIGPTVSGVLEELIPSQTNLEIYNAEYLQRRGSSASVILAAAKASRILGTPEDEVSSTVFNLLNPGVKLSIEVGYRAAPRKSHSNPTLGFRRGDFLLEYDRISSGGRVPVAIGLQI